MNWTSIDLLHTDAYAAVAKNDPYITQVRTGLINHSASLYEQVVNSAIAGSREEGSGSRESDLVTS